MKTLPFYKDYFQVAYGLPKLDLLAAADFPIGESCVKLFKAHILDGKYVHYSFIFHTLLQTKFLLMIKPFKYLQMKSIPVYDIAQCVFGIITLLVIHFSSA